MNTPVNETLYQDNAVELDEEALATILGGSGGYCTTTCTNVSSPCQAAEWAAARCQEGLLGDVLRVLL